jgi:uncharacterized lipoprotein YddW (UPF0748 family)
MTTHPSMLRIALGVLAAGGSLLNLSSVAQAKGNDSIVSLRHQPDIASSTAKKKAPLAGEVRAMWLVRDTMTSPAKIRNAVALAKKYGFNTIFVQVRGRGDAFYDSHFEPRSEELADQPLDFDPLQTAIDAAHKNGLEIHAWLNTFLVWHKGRHPYSGSHVVNQHPDWLVQDKQGHRRITPGPDCEGGFLDPALPQVREYTKNVFMDVATRYAVDGIHMDYVRYPHEGYSFSTAALREFRERLLSLLTPEQVAYADAKLAKNRLAWYYCFPKEWKAWRQEQVTETVRSISLAAHQARPEIIVSAAVFPNYSVASQDKAQAWHDWLQNGFLDAACPMSYNRSTKLVAAQIRDAVAHSGGRPIVAGVGAWQMPAASAIAKSEAFRFLGACGINFFSYDGMTREGRTEAYLKKVAGTLFRTPTTAPDWKRPIVTATTDEPNGG